MKHLYGVSQFAIFEDAKEYLGLAKVTLPEISNKSINLTGAGIPGDLNLPVPGHIEAMSMKIDFFDMSPAAYSLAQQRVHHLHLRVAHTTYDSEQHELGATAFQHILYVIPMKLTSGELAPASAQGVSGEYSCVMRKDFVDGVCVLHYDPINNIYKDSTGNNLLDEIRKATGH